MELEIYRALTKANVAPEDAQAVVQSIHREIDRRYALHAAQLFTRGDGATLRMDLAQDMGQLRQDVAQDLAQLRQDIARDMTQLRQEMAQLRQDVGRDFAQTKVELIKWCVGTMFAAVGLVTALNRLLG